MNIKDFENNTIQYRLWVKAMEYGKNRLAEKIGLIKPVLTKKQAYAMLNQPAVDRAIKSGELKTVKKGGKTSNVYIMREDFEKWIVKDELLSEPVTINGKRRKNK
jgi:hypothetical protein